MSLFIFTCGDLLLMMGHRTRSEALFYYFRLEDQVPENHLLRLIDRHIDLDFIRTKLKGSYSGMGRPSVDPELLLRMLLIGYLYGVTSERKLVEELRMHLAWRWFTGLGFDQEIPHHSTFSKNRHGRFQESNLFQEIFEEIVARCVEAGLVKGEHMSVDGSFIQANADHHRRVAPEELAEIAKVNHTVREYLAELEQENPVEPPVPQQEKVSTTDPDSTYATKGGPARLGYYDNYLLDNGSCVIVGVQATPARISEESAAARDMIERYRERYGHLPQTLAADTTYGNGELLQWLDEHGIAAYIRVKENPAATTDLYGIDKFTYVPEENGYLCPEGKLLKYVGINKRNRTHVYYSTVKRCRECSQKSRCTRGKYRTLAIHTCEPARQRAHALAQTPAFAISQRARRKVEALFAELKNYIGLRRVRLRRMRFVHEQFYLAATAQNLKRLVRFLHRKLTPAGEDRRAIGQTRPLLLVAVGRELSDTAAVWKHGAADRRVTAADWVGSGGQANRLKSRRQGQVSDKLVQNEASLFSCNQKGQLGCHGRMKEGVNKNRGPRHRLNVTLGVYCGHFGMAKWKSQFIFANSPW